MNASPTPIRPLLLLLAAVLVVFAAGCATDPGTADPGRPERPVGTLALPEGTGPANLGLPAGGPTRLELPTGPPLRLELPAGVAATVDIAGAQPAIVITVADAALGFELGAEVPKDPVAANQLIAHLVATLNAAPTADLAAVTVTGYASAEGTTDANQHLSLTRARWVCASLTTAGIPADALSCTGKGETHDLPPTGPGPEDRRVELHLQTTQP